MKINPRKTQDLGRNFEYPEANWLNQMHDLLQGIGLEKINSRERSCDYGIDAIFQFELNQLILVEGQQQVFLDEISR